MEQIKNAWLWLWAWKEAITQFIKLQGMRDRIYKETGEYERMTVEISGQLAWFWPQDSRFPTPINPAIKLAHKVREEANEKEKAEHPERFRTEIAPSGAKITVKEEE